MTKFRVFSVALNDVCRLFVSRSIRNVKPKCYGRSGLPHSKDEAAAKELGIMIYAFATGFILGYIVKLFEVL